MRLKLWVSAVPLIVAGAVVSGQWSGKARPCVSIGDTSVQIAYAPWQDQQRVSFTDSSTAATVRVQIVENAEAADFTVIDDMDTPEAESCSGGTTVGYVAISQDAAPREPVIYLSRDNGADYRIFVASKNFTVREAAALIVAAGRNRASRSTAAL